MRILIAPNAFKGSLSVLDACAAFARGAKSAFPAASLDLMPIADGGDGVMDALRAAKGGRPFTSVVSGPLGRPVEASWALLNDGTACVEMARASGLGLLGKRRAPMTATTRGTGELISMALARGAKRVVVGLGGSAGSDGGVGIAQALGARFLDARGVEISSGAEGLLTLDRIDLSGLKKIRLIGLTDVTNPLLGRRGSAAVYGPQKGATASQVRLIEKALARLAAVAGRKHAATPGAGAAGGCGFGLLALLGAELVPGAAYVLNACGAQKRLRAADAVLTGEGRFDSTSLFGKAPVELARLAKKGGVPAAAVCGQNELSVACLASVGLNSCVTLTEAGATSAQSLTRAARWAEKAAALALTALLSGAVHAADLSAVDASYFHRDQPGKLEETFKLLEGASDAEAQWRLARSLVRRGEHQAEKKAKLADFIAAEAAAEAAVAKSSGTAEAHFWLGIAHGRRGQAQGMMKSLFLVGPIRREMATTIALDPSHGGAHNVLAELYSQLPGFAGGDKKKALEEFETALRLSPRYSANYVPLAEAYLKRGLNEKARDVLDRLAALQDCADPAELAEDKKDGAALRVKLGK